MSEHTATVSTAFTMPSVSEPSQQPLARVQPDEKPLAAQQQQAGAMTPARMIEMAFAHGAGIEQLEKLFDMHERWERNEARKAFIRALSEFKASAPQLIKNKRVRYQNRDKSWTEYDHASLDYITSAINPVLSAFGLAYRWQTEQRDDGLIHVTCVLTHIDGHSERVTLFGYPDESGGKNKIQAVGSTVSYLQRYTLLAVLGMATEGQDNDGRGAPADNAPSGPATLNADQIQELRDAAADAGVDEAYVCQKANVQRIDQIPAARFGAALNHLQRKAAAANQGV